MIQRHARPSRVPGARRARPLVRTSLAAAAIALLCAGLPASANDFEAVGLGSGLAPVEASRIRLLVERVVLTQGEKDWSADATYVFHNPSAERIDTLMAFPEGCPQAERDHVVTGFYANPEFRDLTTSVRGQPVAVRLFDRQPWPGLPLCLGRVHAFDIAFAPGERVEVRHRYRFSSGMGIGYEQVQYILRTGALWNGPIGRAELIVSPRAAAFGLSWPDQFRFLGFEERLGAPGDSERVVYRFAATDWKPSQDFTLNLHGWPLAGSLATENGIASPCPDAAQVASEDGSGAPDLGAEDLLSELSDSALALCRNLPYARHGYPFERPALRALFDREAETPGDEDGPSHRRFRLGTANPFYSDALLDRTDQAYLSALKAEQERRTAASGNPEIAALVRGALPKGLQGKTRVGIRSLKIVGDWALAHARPESADGKRRYEDLNVLLRKTDGRWQVAEVLCSEVDNPRCLGGQDFPADVRARFPGLPAGLID